MMTNFKFVTDPKKWVKCETIVPGDIIAWSVPSCDDHWQIARATWWSCFWMVTARDCDNLLVYNMRNTNFTLLPADTKKVYRLWQSSKT